MSSSPDGASVPRLITSDCVDCSSPPSGLEPMTSSLPRKCSTTELGGRFENSQWSTFRITTGETAVAGERETGFEPATFSLEG